MALIQQTTNVRRAGAQDREQIAEVLSRAFHDDPAFVWVFPDPERRRRVLPGFFAAFVDAFSRHDETRVAPGAPGEPGAAGAALWAPPGPPVAEEDAGVLAASLFGLAGPDAGRLAEIDDLLAQHHPEDACWFLQFVGVDPSRQGRGVGSALMVPVLAHCDAQGLPAYLEATSPDNRRLYERYGFVVRGEIVLPGGPALWPMWREPGSGPLSS